MGVAGRWRPSITSLSLYSQYSLKTVSIQLHRLAGRLKRVQWLATDCVLIVWTPSPYTHLLPGSSDYHDGDDHRETHRSRHTVSTVCNLCSHYGPLYRSTFIQLATIQSWGKVIDKLHTSHFHTRDTGTVSVTFRPHRSPTVLIYIFYHQVFSSLFLPFPSLRTATRRASWAEPVCIQ